MDKSNSNTARKVNILDEINKDDFQEESVESKEELTLREGKKQSIESEPEFLFEEQMYKFFNFLFFHN